MKMGTILPLLVGSVVTVGVLNYFRAKPPARPTYYAAMTDIDVYQRVSPTFVEIREWTEAAPLPAEYISDARRMYPTDGSATQLRFVRRKIEAGKPITEADLFPLTTPTLLKAILMDKPDTCAVPVKVDAVQGGAGFVEPGDRVDVLAVLPSQNGSALDLMAKPILHGIMVLAVNQSDTPSAGGGEKLAQPKSEADLPRSVTLALTPKQSVSLSAVAAAPNARIQLILRDKNAAPDSNESVSLRDAMGIPKDVPVVAAPPPALPAAPKKPPSTVIQVWRGSAREQHVFSKDGKHPTEGEEGDEADGNSEIAAPPRQSAQSRGPE